MLFKVTETRVFEHYVGAEDEDEARSIVEKKGSVAYFELRRDVQEIKRIPSFVGEAVREVDCEEDHGRWEDDGGAD